jgi:hypothetical protein
MKPTPPLEQLVPRPWRSIKFQDGVDLFMLALAAWNYFKKQQNKNLLQLLSW